MKKTIALELNSIDLLKHAMFKDYVLPEEAKALNLTQERILMTVKKSINVSMVSISRAIGLEKGPFSQTVDKLEKLGLLTRYRSQNDKRLVHLKLTEMGEELTQKIEESMNLHFSERIKFLTDEERKNLYDGLDKINQIANILINNHSNEKNANK